MPAFSIGDCISFGWETFKKRPGILIGAFLLTIIVPAIPGLLFPGPELVPGQPPPMPTAPEIIATLVGMVLSVFAHLGAVLFSLRAHDDVEHVQISDLWNPKPFWRFLGTEIIFSIAVFVGLLLLVAPGIILALGFGFAFYIVVERGAGPIKSLEESWRITRGYKWQLLGLTLVIIGINLLGAIAFLVGLLVSVPVSWLAITHAYRTLQARAG